MRAETANRDTLTLQGITTRASNAEGERLGAHWQRFFAEDVRGRVAGRLDDVIVAVYHDYAGDHTQPYSFFLGCSVPPEAPLAEGLERCVVPAGRFARWKAEGEQPQALIHAWQEIWQAPLERRYEADFEIHDPSRPQCVEIFVGV